MSYPYLGLSNKIEITPGKRTPFSSDYQVPFVNCLLTTSDQKVPEIRGEMIFPFSAQKCFDVMKDYRKFLLSNLKDNERLAMRELNGPFHAQPRWCFEASKQAAGTEGSMVQYAYYLSGVVHWVVDKVTKLEDGISVDQ